MQVEVETVGYQLANCGTPSYSAGQSVAEGNSWLEEIPDKAQVWSCLPRSIIPTRCFSTGSIKKKLYFSSNGPTSERHVVAVPKAIKATKNGYGGKFLHDTLGGGYKTRPGWEHVSGPGVNNGRRVTHQKTDPLLLVHSDQQHQQGNPGHILLPSAFTGLSLGMMSWRPQPNGPELYLCTYY